MRDPVNYIPRLKTNSNREYLNNINEIDIYSAVNKFIDTAEQIDNNESQTDIINNLLNVNLTLNNYEEICLLTKYHAVELQPTVEESIKNICYKNADGIAMAIVQIYTKENKIKIHTFGNIFPKQEFTSPQDVLNRILINAKWSNWSTEDGGINQFDGNIETRYKNTQGHVMAAVITKADGRTVDTIVEYQYKNGKKTGMLHTNQYGQSLTVYDGSNDLTQVMSVYIDTDGYICSITHGLSNMQ